jgi:N-acetylglucosamine kinase-like BadF-type ATPase
MDFVLGVDGGSTKTIALVARRDGTIVGVGRRGCSSIYNAGMTEQAALGEAEQAVRAALDAGGVRPGDLAAGVFSMCGADWPEDIALIEDTMQRCGFGRMGIVVNDAFGALRAGSEDGTGVVVVCGTGAAIGARAADGRTWHAGFWQEPQGAEDLGRQTLRAVYRAQLGIGEPTTLTRRVLEFFYEERVEELLHRLTARDGSRPVEIGRLAPILLEEAGRGDVVARRLVEGHGRALGEYALAAARHVGIERTPFTLVLAGGVLRHPSHLLAKALVARVRDGAPEVRAVPSRFEPAVGALFLALEAAGMPVDVPLLERLIPTLPPVSLFAT